MKDLESTDAVAILAVRRFEGSGSAPRGRARDFLSLTAFVSLLIVVTIYKYINYV